MDDETSNQAKIDYWIRHAVGKWAAWLVFMFGITVAAVERLLDERPRLGS